VDELTLNIRISALILLGVFGTSACAQPVAQCPPQAGVTLQILGSGGPIADDGRASSGYVVWVDGRSRVLVDAGGGTFLRFGEAGADFAELDFVGLSHFHTDHSADFPALLKSGYFSQRERPLTVSGPGAGGPFPGLVAYLDSLLAPGSGAYGYLAGYLDGSGGLARLEKREIAWDQAAPVRVFGADDGEIRVDALPVPHGIVPALGFRVQVRDVTIVFASDQNGSDPAFIDFAKDATALIMHMPVPEGATGGALQLHAQPGLVGEIAAKASAERLILSHFMARSLRDLDSNIDVVREAYDGEIVIGSDLVCIALTD
jgi:ribonuclease BN (tRNA processing enzyme)